MFLQLSCPPLYCLVCGAHISSTAKIHSNSSTEKTGRLKCPYRGHLCNPTHLLLMFHAESNRLHKRKQIATETHTGCIAPKQHNMHRILSWLISYKFDNVSDRNWATPTRGAQCMETRLGNGTHRHTVFVQEEFSGDILALLKQNL